MITDQLKRRVPGDVREQFVDNWVKSIVPGDLADKLDEYESVRANVRGAHSNDARYRPTNNKFVSDNKGANLQPKDAPFFRKTKLPVESNTGTSRGFKPKCFICENVGHLARECPKNTRKTPPRNARSNTITAKGTELESTKEVVTARVSIPVSVPINTRNGIDDLQFVDIKCGQTSIKAVIDTGAQISVLREDLIGKDCGEGEGTIQIISAFGEKEIAALKLFNLKIDDGKHGSVPIMCAVSKKLVNDMLISATAYEILLENVQLFDFENQRDFECTKGKDIQLESEEKLSTLALGQETETSETNLAKFSFVKLQRMDESLGPVWSQAKNKQNAYEIDDGVLIHTESICGEDVKQVVLPTCKREEVMKVAHEIPLAGHLGESKTKQRIKYSFFWPKLKQDVRKTEIIGILHLPYLMFAYREVPHSTTGVSPYQLFYGRLPNGPLKLLKEVWTGDKEIPTGSSKSLEEYLRDLTGKLKPAHNLARGNSEKAQAEYTSRYNLRSREKRLAVGDQVLVLIPSSSHKLLKKWMGPASIIELPRPHTARVKMDDGSEKELHFYKLRPYIARIEQIGLIFDQDDEFGELHYAPTDTVELDVNDIYNHVMDSSSGLENSQKHQLADLLSKFSDVFSSDPGSAKVKGHSEELVKMPSLHTPDLSRPFLLFTDASATAIGACLAQHKDHMEEMPIAFFSKKLTLAQMKWSTIEREAFSVLEALRKFDTWIFGSQIQVISDHDPLTYLTNSAPHSAKLTRWALALQRYNVKVSYRRGSAHGNADALSRLRISE
ncbi:retrovirus-related Pol polyprotein from transposon gypsy [Trichonephila clavata]|uniref:RNA-directed DNA polymerase n=2 Tax=Trichonephila clavata TaxID=2740835 RepID=A0A8X6FKI8_TRICU|nr:retrovirus-related Pol polyprotein from transposon gypsy [Trichonephila clavata]